MPGMEAVNIQGNIIYVEKGLRQRWLHAFGPTINFVRFKGFDWPVLTDNLAGFVGTLVEAGASESTVSLAIAEVGGGLLITSDANENDGVNLQMKGTAFQCAAGKPFYFGCRFKVSEATQSDFYVGLAVVSTDALGGVTDGVAFRKPDGSAACVLVVEKNSTETTAAALTVDTSFHAYEIVWDGATLNFYVDGVQLATPAQTNVPDDERLTPTIQFLNGDANSRTMTIDWLAAGQIN